MKILYNRAGLVCFEFGKYSLHLLCKPEHWIFGRETEEYDCCLEYFGLGPIALLVWPP